MIYIDKLHCNYQAWLLTLIYMNSHPWWFLETDSNHETDLLLFSQLKSILGDRNAIIHLNMDKYSPPQRLQDTLVLEFINVELMWKDVNTQLFCLNMILCK